MAQVVVGVFDAHSRAVRAVGHLRDAGVAAEKISLLAPDAREVEGYSEEVGVRIVQAGGAGLAAGGALGGLAGWLVGVTGLLVPGAGFVIAAGPIVGLIVGAVGGATVGGVVGIFVGLGLPRSAAEELQRELSAGRTLVMVETNGEYALAQDALGDADPRAIRRFENGAELDALGD